MSTKCPNTVSVLVETTKRHRLYRKSFARSRKYLADDSLKVSEGDIVEIEKTRPISKRKHWKVIKVLGKDVVALGEQVLAQATREAIEEVLPAEEETVVSSPLPVTEKANLTKKRTKKEKATSD